MMRRRFLLLTILAVMSVTSCGQADTGELKAKASEALLARDYQAAEESYQSLVDEGCDLETSYRGLGIAQMGRAQYDKAASSFEHALQEAGVIPGKMEYDINYYLGSCYYKLGQYDKALEVFDAIAALRPRDAGVLQMRATVKIQLGDLPGMNEDFRKAIDLDPTDFDRIVSIYGTMDENGYGDDAKKYIEQVLETQDQVLGDYDRGRLYYCIGDYTGAQKALESQKDSMDYRVTILLGQTYEALGDYNYAANVYETFVSRDVSHAEVYNQLGLCYVKMQDYRSALTAFENGKKVENNTVLQSLSFNEIVAYEYLGDFQKASVLMQDYLDKYPGDENARREYTFLKHAREEEQT